jgi:SAM-dependent methyltransferase
MKPEQEFLHEMFYKDCLDTVFNNQPVRIQYIDIETEISDVFVRAKDATNRINMITIYDSLTEKFYTWSLEHSEIDFREEPLCNYPKDKFVFFEFANNESRLLEHFLDWIEKVANNCYDNLKKGGYLILVIGNCYKDGEELTLGVWAKDRFCKDKKFKCKSHIIKDYGETKELKERTII